MNISYIRVLNVLESFASEHLQIKKFSSDFPAQIPNFGNKDEEYPILFVSPSNSIFNTNTKSFDLNIYCFDLIQADRENINTILSDTNSILNDLVIWLQNSDQAGLDLIDSSTATPINNSLLDYCAGWVMTIKVEVDNYTLCDIPFENLPISTECNDIVYNKYLTCESLGDCPEFQQIENDILDLQNQIDGIISSGLTDTYITGGTYNNNTGIATFTRSNGATFQVTGFTGSGNAILSGGVTNRIAKWASATGVTNSNISDNGSLISITGNTTISGNLTASTIVKAGGTSTQFLKADGSVDSNTYALNSALHNPVTLGTANGLSLSGQQLSLGLATSLLSGALSNTDWNTFNNKQDALGYTPVNQTRTISTTSPLQGGGDLTTDRTLSISQATTSTNGYLSSTDWNIFNNKQATLVSGTNIKTVNGYSLVGAGNVQLTDIYVTGGTLVGSTATFVNNTGGTFSITGFGNSSSSADTYTTGFTFNPATYDLQIKRNDNVTLTANLALLASDMTVTGGTYNPATGIVTFTNNTGGTFTVNGFTTGMTDTFTTGGTLTSGNITFTKNNGGTYSVSGVQSQLNGTGFVKAAGTSISYDNNTYALDANALHTTGNEIKTGDLNIIGDLTATTIQTGSLNIGNAPLTEDLLYLTNATLSTGLFFFNNGGITSTASTTFNLGRVHGWIIDSSDPLNNTPTFINFAGQSGITIPNISTNAASYIFIDNTSNVHIQNTAPTVTDRRNMIYLGVIGHPLGTVTGIGVSPDIIMNEMSQVRAMFTPIRFINDGVIPYANSTDLSLANTAGKLFGLGIGWVQNGNNAPSVVNINGGAPTTFQYRSQTGQTFSNTTLIDPTIWDNNGVITTVTNANNATNQRIYLLQNGNIRIQFGQRQYGTLAQAIAGATTESFNTFINNKNLGILIGIVSIKKNATNLSDTAQAQILLVSKFGESVGASAGISTTNLQQAYNNSDEPEIITNATRNGVSIRIGSGSNSDALLNLQNSGGTTVAGINGNGQISGTSFVKSGGTSSQFLKADGSVDSTTYTPTTRTISTTSPLQGGGDLSGDRTLSILTATTSVTGVLTSTDWNTFNSKQSALVSGTNIKTVNSTSLLGSGDVAVQATLVSGTNIKTINGNSILGSGNLVITGASGTDVFVTGGTYTAGTATFTNNTGGTFSVTGFSTGATGGGGGSPWMATNAGNPTQSPIAIGTDAIAIGDGAYANDDDMISIGSGAGNGPFLGINCISIGKGAGTNSLIPISSIFIGVDAGRDSYDSGICIGTYAGKNSTSFNSVFIGQSAGESASNAETTIGIGYQAGKFFTGNDIGTNNIIIGTNISLPNATANAINLGGILFGTGAYSTTTGNPSISANTAGRIGIGVVNPVEKLDVSGAVRTTQLKLVALNTAPSSSGDTGTLGEIRWDANYMYVCTAPNTWKRSQLNSW